MNPIALYAASAKQPVEVTTTKTGSRSTTSISANSSYSAYHGYFRTSSLTDDFKDVLANKRQFSLWYSGMYSSGTVKYYPSGTSWANNKTCYTYGGSAGSSSEYSNLYLGLVQFTNNTIKSITYSSDTVFSFLARESSYICRSKSSTNAGVIPSSVDSSSPRIINTYLGTFNPNYTTYFCFLGQTWVDGTKYLSLKYSKVAVSNSFVNTTFNYKYTVTEIIQ